MILDEKQKRREKNKAATESLYSKANELNKVTLDDFDLIRVLGRGAFGKVNTKFKFN